MIEYGRESVCVLVSVSEIMFEVVNVLFVLISQGYLRDSS